MKKLKVFISHNENSFEAAQKIKNESLQLCEVIYIEDFVKNNDYNLIDKDDIIHFSCNSDLIHIVIEKISFVDCFIFNKNFLLQKYDKLEMQELLRNYGINVPKIYKTIDEVILPVFCKENKHTGIIFQAFTTSTIKRIFEKFNVNDFYFEENLFEKNGYTSENKYYYANGIVCAKNGKRVSKKVKEICRKINDCFDIDIYSVDIISNLKGIYLIDFNQAVGYYLSDRGRSNFLKMVDKIARGLNEN